MAETPRIAPVDYTSRDFPSLRDDMLNKARLMLPEWTSRDPSDFGVVLVELFAYVGDTMHYYIDRAMNEAFLATATRRSSILAIAKMFGYVPVTLAPAKATLSFTATGALTVPAGTRVQTVPAVGEDPFVFDTDAALVFDSGPYPKTLTVGATQGSTWEAEQVGTSDGTANQRYQLFHPLAVDSSIVVSVDDGGGPIAWARRDDIIDATGTERVYSIETDDADTTHISFGDNVNGRIPPSGADIFVTYRTCDGAQGNVAAGTIVQLETPIEGITAVTNASAATGGRNAESAAAIRDAIPRSLSALQRAVTLDDYAALAVGVPGVAKAAAEATVWNSVIVYIAPVGGGAPSANLTTQVETYLEPRRLIGVTVTVDEPTYVPVDLTATVDVHDEYVRSAVEVDVAKAVDALFAFDNVGFGKDVYLSDVYRALASVEGVKRVDITKLDTSGGSDAEDVTIAANEIAKAGTVTLGMTGGIV